MILATRFGFPVSTKHALLGAMAGRAVGCGDDRNRINRERCGSFLTASYGPV
ncbi:MULTISPECIES: hypothetical protein [Methylomicrobium]|uniref:hypothetical protein n=1 Tax=Methylomicrobium TaxID=39773 RepID=UPI000309682F|nr:MULTISPECIES: hypothetical protein [Methylomicrobium]